MSEQGPIPAEASSVHRNVFRDKGQWYFWYDERGAFDGPFPSDTIASRAAHAYDMDRATTQGRDALELYEGSIRSLLAGMSKMCRALNDTWWRDPDTLEPLVDRNRGELIALMHSELSEALEGLRKDRNDDHLPHRKQVEVELADLLIRVFDFAGESMLGSEERPLDLGGALVEKCRYNLVRQDHRVENRRAGSGGKRF